MFFFIPDLAAVMNGFNMHFSSKNGVFLNQFKASRVDYSVPIHKFDENKGTGIKFFTVDYKKFAKFIICLKLRI